MRADGKAVQEDNHALHLAPMVQQLVATQRVDHLCILSLQGAKPQQRLFIACRQVKGTRRHWLVA